MSKPNRAQRRRLSTRAERALAKARGSVLAMTHGNDYALITEPGDVQVIPADEVPYVLSSLGLDWLRRDLERTRVEHARSWIPYVVIIDSYASGGWLETHALSRGGDA